MMCCLKDGYTPLHWAALYNQVEMVNFLVEKRAELSVQNRASFVNYFSVHSMSAIMPIRTRILLFILLRREGMTEYMT